MDDLISTLSEIRSQYNCFDESEEPYYRALSEAIKALSKRADEDTISRQAAIDAVADLYWMDERLLNFKKEIDKVYDKILNLPSAQPEAREIGYAECANAMLKMWIDNVLTDGEYNRIMDKLNEHWGKVNARHYL